MAPKRTRPASQNHLLLTVEAIVVQSLPGKSLSRFQTRPACAAGMPAPPLLVNPNAALRVRSVPIRPRLPDLSQNGRLRQCQLPTQPRSLSKSSSSAKFCTTDASPVDEKGGNKPCGL